MPDITMCQPSDCSVKETCYRYTATPTPNWQAYSDFFTSEDEMCKYFIANVFEKDKETQDDN